MKHIFTTLLGISISVGTHAQGLKNKIQVEIGGGSAGTGTNIDEWEVFIKIKDWLFAGMGILSIIMLLWIGAKIILFPPEEDDLKKGVKAIVYIAIGLAIIPAAYFIISNLLNLKL